MSFRSVDDFLKDAEKTLDEAERTGAIDAATRQRLVQHAATVLQRRPTSPIASAGKPVAERPGFNCKCCNERNDFAEANQDDGTYVCFNCRIED